MKALDPVAIRDRIVSRGKELQKTQRSYLAEAGLNASFLKEAARGSVPRLDSLARLAAVLEVTPEWLAYGAGPRDDARWLRVVGSVEAGIWQEPRAASRRERAPLPPDPRFAADAQYLLEVRGASLDRIAPAGALLHCLDVAASGVEPRHGDVVVVERWRPSGEVEITAKRLARRGARLVFAAESDDPAWAGQVLDAAEAARGGVTLRARALVLRVVIELWR